MRGFRSTIRDIATGYAGVGVFNGNANREDYGPIPNIRIPDLLFTVFRPHVDTPFVLRQWCALPAR